MSTLYKTKNGMQDGFVPGVGAIVNGMIEGPDNLESPNLVKVDQPQIAASQTAPAAPVASPQPTPAPATNIITPPAAPATAEPAPVATKENA